MKSAARGGRVIIVLSPPLTYMKVRCLFEGGEGALNARWAADFYSLVLRLIYFISSLLPLQQGAFEKRAASVRHKLSELQARRQARSSLLEALEEAEVQAAEGSAQLAAQRAHLSGSQKRHAESEVQWIGSVKPLRWHHWNIPISVDHFLV